MMKPQTESGKRPLKAKVASAAKIFMVIVVGCVALVLFLPSLILNTYIRGKLQNGFAATHPGHVLRLGALRYSWGDAGLTTDSVRLTAPAYTLTSGPITIRHARWGSFLGRKPELPKAFAQATLLVTNLALEFSNPRYELRCARIEARVPAASLSAETISLQPQMIDEAFLAASPFSATRYRVAMRACRVQGVSYSELLQGTGYRAQRMDIWQPEFDALVSREKPSDPQTAGPLMLHQALAKLGHPVALDMLTVTNGTISYCERRAAGGPAGKLVFAELQMVAKGIVSPPPSGAVISVEAETSFMNAGLLKATLLFPLAPRDFALSYSGSLGPMDITRLNEFLEIAERIRVTSGRAKAVTFSVEAKGGRASGSVRPIYTGLKIAFLNAETGSKHGMADRAKSFLANALKLRETNPPDRSSSVHVGKVDYQLKPDDTLLKFIWYALRSGVLDGIHL